MTQPLWMELRKRRASAERVGKLAEHLGLAETPLIWLCKRLGVGLWHASAMQDDSQLRIDAGKDGAHIYLNPALSREDQRWNIAHQIGHLMLHDLGPTGVHRDGSHRKATRQDEEANAFAGELLMPHFPLAIYSHSVKYDSALIAQMFGVTRAAVNLRFQHLHFGAP